MALVSEFLGELTLSYGGSTAQYDASELKASMKGLGTDEETLIEMVCSRNNEELLEIKRVYREMFKKELDKEVAGDTSGDFAKLLLALVQSYSPYDMKESIRKEVKGDLEKSFLTLVECFENRQYIEHTKGDYQKALLSLCGGDD
ncbi:Annexin A2 [Dissostichus eleginoides]|uniref:Annexin n=1 Tax=Dissostichus eleginoides TaxID=100907 RepID=A0AAD9C0V3_DISEL|nr:Annexin A2 [Dissostichus eleginoides]